MREMLAENRLHPSDFILPLFICEGSGCEEPIGSLPGVSRWSVDRIAERAKEAASLGIPCIALFPNTPNELRTEDAREALNPDNLICRATLPPGISNGRMPSADAPIGRGVSAQSVM